MTKRTGELRLGHVLANAAREMEAMAAKASMIDEAVGDLLVDYNGGRLPVALLQDVDLLRQSVDCIQILIGNLSRQELGDCLVCPELAGEGVYLEAIRKGCLDRYGAKPHSE